MEDLNCLSDLEIPSFIERVLLMCGYNTVLSLKQINSEKISAMEKHINKFQRNSLTILLNNDNDVLDNTVNVYKSQLQFQFLPGHRVILLDIPNKIKQIEEEEVRFQLNKNVHSETMAEYSTIFTKLIETANRNKNVSKNAYKYDETIKYFATYIFTLCGRTCFETLNKNIPIPSTKTICK